jgi:Mg-chelatase subunit ChlD
LIDWDSLTFERVWPLWLGVAAAIIFFALWFYKRRTHFPDIMLLTDTVTVKGIFDRLPIIFTSLVLGLIIIVLMQPTVIRSITIDQRARDFLVIFDTSRSMRHDTNVNREELDLRFERRAGTFSTAVDDPNSLPMLARYELARESLLSFLSQRKAQDRVGLIFFNDNAFTMSAPTANIDFVIEQLASMDEYVNWGTDIALAMETGLNLFDRYPQQNKKAVILLTDAEAAYTKDVEQQLTRLASMGVSFYLLWITTDENDMSNEEVEKFLNYARTVGTVVTIENLDARNLENTLRDISRLEGYSYKESRRERINLSGPFLQAARILIILWLFLVATYFHPSTGRNFFKGGNI